MANLTRSFSSGIMNKMVDDRLIPNGQYIDALNIRMGSTEGADIGVIENSKGNSSLTSLSFGGVVLSSSARCIGAFEDGTNETLYWFVHDSAFTGSATGKIDLVLSFDTKTNSIIYHIVSINDGNGVDTTLNFNPKNLITGVNKVEDLLYFTDNWTDPKQINVTRNYANPVSGVDAFSLESVLVIKKPPVTSPTINPVATSSQDNFLENRFVSFAYRYRYEDAEYSATSQFSAPSFIPKSFDYNVATALNDGMLNSTNMCSITYNSGGPLVKSVDLLFKDMNSSVIKIIEKINKQESGLADNTEYTYNFDNSKIFTILPSSEILRLYDNVPRLAEAQTLMGNRLVYGNYLEGYDLKDTFNNPTKFEYFVNSDSENIGFSGINYTLTSGSFSWDGAETLPRATLQFDLTGIELVAGASLSFLIRFEHGDWSGNTPEPTDETQETTIDFQYILPVTFSSAYALATSVDFQEKMGTATNIQTVANSCTGVTFTDLFNCSVPNEHTQASASVFKYASGISGPGQSVLIVTSPSSESIGIQLPAMLYVDDLTGVNITFSAYEYYNIAASEVTYQELGDPKSLHSNRGYEIGMVYMDDYSRMSTALVSKNNSIHIPCNASSTANSIRVTIPSTQVAPSWAKRYKFVIKPDKKDYDVIYSNFFFRDPTSGGDWFLLEGQNSSKIEIGDELIVKTDTVGSRQNCTWTTVLDKQAQLKDFLLPVPVDSAGNDIPIPAGTYMKLMANNFSTEVGELPVVAYGEKRKAGSGGCPTIGYPVDTPNTNPANTGEWIDYDIPAGSRISIRIFNHRRGNTSALWGNVGEKKWVVEADFTSSALYTNFKQWFDSDNIAAALEAQATDIIGDVEGPNYISSYTNSRPCDTGNLYTNFYQTGAGTPQQRTYFNIKGSEGYGGDDRKATTLEVEIAVIRAANTIIFESDPQDAEPDLWYESSTSYPISTIGEHSGSVQNQNFASNTPAIISTDFFNCYAFGNGAESYKIQDSMTGRELVLGNRATTTDSKLYGAEQRFSDLTYSGVYNAESNINKLNEFNSGLLNFKVLEQSFGPVMKLFARETDILVLQEDKISYVLAGKNLLSDAGGGNALTSVPEVLGTQIARVENFGISHNPESFAQWGADKFFTDAKRGVVVQLKGASAQSDQLKVISSLGMRTWFRDLYNTSFSTQKLGGYDPYMNEFVLSANGISTPAPAANKNCGITETIEVVPATNYEAIYDLGELVGTVDIDYAISGSGTFSVSATYGGVTTTTGNVTTGGTLTINKGSVLDDTVSVVISAQTNVSLTFTVDCPSADTITIVLVQVSSDNDMDKQIHDEYRWTDGTFQSPLHSEQVILSSGSSPIVSLYQTITGQQGGGVIPSNTAEVNIISNKFGSDTFNFNINSDNFRYLRSDTLYNNNAAEIQALMLASTVPATINPPTNGNTSFYSTFQMPASGNYLYLVWDYRSSTPIDLCFESSAALACCNCAPSSNIYQIEDCTSGAIFTIEDTYLNGIGINSVVQYVQGIGAGVGTYVYCGTVIGFGTVVDATLYSNVTQTCGDVINCNFDPTVTCTEYIISVFYSASAIGYSYTDCSGNFVTSSIGGINGLSTKTLCAQTGMVNFNGIDVVVANGSCNY